MSTRWRIGGAAALATAAAFALLLSGCDSGGPDPGRATPARAGFRASLPEDLSGRPLVVVDEAFAAARPGLLRALEAESRRGPDSRRPFILRLGFEESPALVVELLGGLEADSWPSGILMSPLLGLALAGSSPPAPAGGRAGRAATWPPRLVVEARLPPTMAELSLDSDWIGAMSFLGRAFGRYSARLRAREGGSPAAGLLLSEGRGAEPSIRAFVEAYRKEAGEEPSIEEVAGSGQGRQASTLETGQALARLRERDLRLVLVAAGDAAPAACAALDAAGLPYGVLGLEEGGYPGGMFRILPDDSALARKALEALRPPAPPKAPLEAKDSEAVRSENIPLLIRAPEGEEENEFLLLLRAEVVAEEEDGATKPRLDASPRPWKRKKGGILSPLRPISRP